MKILKGQTVTVCHKRKGVFLAKATDDIDTELDEFYSFTLLEPVRCLTGILETGEIILCRHNFCTVRLGA